METNETALQSQQQILEENEERVKKIRQETEQSAEDGRAEGAAESGPREADRKSVV